MLIDCDTCRVRDTDACDDCVVTFFLSGGPLDLDGSEQAAIERLAEAGLVPRLRLISPPTSRAG